MRAFLSVLLVGCATEQATQIQLPVTTAAAPLPAATTDLGYTVQIASLELAVSNVQLTIEGESHEEAARVAGPRPHPGHSAGGEVTGELVGDFVLVWNGQARPAIGNATLLVGDYKGANFALRAATSADGVDAAMIGHAFHVTGTVEKAGTTKAFDALLDVEADTFVVGATFEASITEASTAPLELAFYPVDPNEGDTPFDGVDFFALAPEGDAIAIRPGDTAHNIIRRAIQTHDHYGIATR